MILVNLVIMVHLVNLVIRLILANLTILAILVNLVNSGESGGFDDSVILVMSLVGLVRAS